MSRHFLASLDKTITGKTVKTNANKKDLEIIFKVCGQLETSTDTNP